MFPLTVGAVDLEQFGDADRCFGMFSTDDRNVFAVIPLTGDCPRRSDTIQDEKAVIQSLEEPLTAGPPHKHAGYHEPSAGDIDDDQRKLKIASNVDYGPFLPVRISADEFHLRLTSDWIASRISRLQMVPTGRKGLFSFRFPKSWADRGFSISSRPNAIATRFEELR